MHTDEHGLTKCIRKSEFRGYRSFALFFLIPYPCPSVCIRGSTRLYLYLCASVSLWQNRLFAMLRRLNYRLLIVALLILGLAAIEIAREYRPSFLRPGLRLYAYVGNAGDGTVSVIDLIRVGKIATIAVGPAPSGLRANPELNQVWGVSTDGGYAFVIDTPLARFPRASQWGCPRSRWISLLTEAARTLPLRARRLWS